MQSPLETLIGETVTGVSVSEDGRTLTVDAGDRQHLYPTIAMPGTTVAWELAEGDLTGARVLAVEVTEYEGMDGLGRLTGTTMQRHAIETDRGPPEVIIKLWQREPRPKVHDPFAGSD